jgi:hypothetical protein
MPQVDYPIRSRRDCFPELARAVAAAQAREVRIAIDASLPFGLTTGPRAGATDLFVAIGDKMHGSAVYRGLHHREWLVQCDHQDGGNELWVISSSDDREAWGRCEGRLWIELQTSQALTDPSDRSEASDGVHFQLGMDQCSEMLAAESSRLAPILSDGTNGLDADSVRPDPHTLITFPENASARRVQCTLLWLFGAHSTVRANAQTATVRLPSRIERIELVGDLVVRTGTFLRLEAETTATLVVGSRQLRVEQGGQLELVGITITDSVGSTALLSEGDVKAFNSSFTRCETRTNLVQRFGEAIVPLGSDANPPIRGALLQAAGGAIRLIWSSAKLAVRGGMFLSNSARGARSVSAGGALHALGGQISLEDTTFQQNWVEATVFMARGGAGCLVYVALRIVNCRFMQNEARRGLMTRGGALEIANSDGQILRAVFEGNVAMDGQALTSAGGISVAEESKIEIHNCRLLRNQALRGGHSTVGGAVTLDRGAYLTVAEAVFEGNAACGYESAGGAMFLQTSSTLVLEAGVVFRSNNASSATNAHGGAITVRELAVLVADQAPHFIGNMVRTSSACVACRRTFDACPFCRLQGPVREQVAMQHACVHANADARSHPTHVSTHVRSRTDLHERSHANER